MKRIPMMINAQTVEQLRASLQTKAGMKISKKKLFEMTVAILWEQVGEKGLAFLFERGLLDDEHSKRRATTN